ncbi:MAG: glycosyltransferase [bacterium]|nr:glycosyltransferase [bacterium]
MVQKSAYIISLKFAPGLKKEFMVLGENIRKKGINVKYLLSDRYARLEGKCDGIEYITTADDVKGMMLDTIKLINGRKFKQIFSQYPPLFLCFYNPHPLNPFIARLIKKKYPEVKLALYLHDPYKPDKMLYGIAKAAYINLVEFIQGLTIKYMNYVISPSKYSSQLFKKRYPTFNGENHIAPLLVPDKRVSENKKRKFFSIVGGAHPATGHDTFVELVNYVTSKRLDYEFALISSSNISKYLEKLNNEAQKRIKIVNKKIILDSEINEIIRESYAVFRLDREVTQSGVIPVAYMNETLVIARDIPGLRQHVRHKQNGYIVPFKCMSEDLIKAMEFVRKNFVELSKNARSGYEETWADWNWDKYYGWLSEIVATF